MNATEDGLKISLSLKEILCVCEIVRFAEIKSLAEHNKPINYLCKKFLKDMEEI
jgi:hypothetical protein